MYKMVMNGGSVETKYHNLWDINLLDYDRSLTNLSEFKGKKLLFMTFASDNVRNTSFMDMLKESKEALAEKNIQVIGLPTNTNRKERKTFKE